MPDADQILTIREVAALLKIGEKTTYTMVQTGELPGFKVRGQWRFRKTDLDAWIHSQVERSLQADRGTATVVQSGEDDDPRGEG